MSFSSAGVIENGFISDQFDWYPGGTAIAFEFSVPSEDLGTVVDSGIGYVATQYSASSAHLLLGGESFVIWEPKILIATQSLPASSGSWVGDYIVLTGGWSREETIHYFQSFSQGVLDSQAPLENLPEQLSDSAVVYEEWSLSKIGPVDVLTLSPLSVTAIPDPSSVLLGALALSVFSMRRCCR